MDIKLDPDDSDSEVDTSLLCRGCLVTSGEMKNMSDWGLTEDFYRTTNIEASNSEGLSELLCVNCEEALVKCRQWIAQCQESDAYLKDTAKKKLEALNATKMMDEDRNIVQNTVSCLLLDNNLVITIIAPDMTSKIVLPCPHNCQGTFAKKPDLLHHMIKLHHVGSTFAIDLQYYCPFYTCAYYMNSGKSKFFSGRKALNQHINKVHGKNHSCQVCNLNFSTLYDYDRHLKTCNFTFQCQACSSMYKSNDRLLVHLLRRHPALHKQYKERRKAEKRKAKTHTKAKKRKPDPEKIDYMCDSPKRSFATQTLDNIKNDVTLPSWSEKPEETKRDEISTQTVFEDLLSLKSNDEESIFFSETVSLSDIQTQTFPLEFGLSRSNKETLTSETQSPDLSLKGTQTCLCLYDSPKSNRFLDSVSSSPGNNFISTETQTGDVKDSMNDLLSFTSIETQTCFDELNEL